MFSLVLNIIYNYKGFNFYCSFKDSLFVLAELLITDSLNFIFVLDVIHSYKVTDYFKPFK